jgi:hypothetical protein
MTDLVVSGREIIQLDVPLDAFSIRPADFHIELSACLADGTSLPEWITFDSRLGRFDVSAPEYLDQDVSLQLIASSADGQRAVVDFKIMVRNPQDHAYPVLPGRQGLTEKLKLAAGERVSNHRHVARASL